MDVPATLAWMKASWLGQLTAGNSWGFPTLESLHFVGLVLLIGAVFIIDLRVLGLAPRIPARAVMAFLPWAFIGFIINLITGVLFFFAEPNNYYGNIAFRLKMVAVLLAGLNALWFRFAAHPRGAVAPVDVQFTPQAQWIAAFSLFLWLAVIVLGRLIPFVR